MILTLLNSSYSLKYTINDFFGDDDVTYKSDLIQ